MRLIWYDGFIFGSVFIILFMFVIPYCISDSNPESRFSGNAESFDFSVQSSSVHFKAKNIQLRTNETMFTNVRNITIESTTGEMRLINSSHSLQVLYNEKIGQSFSNVDITILFEKPTRMTKNLDLIYNLSGISNSMNLIFLNDGKIVISRYGVNTVIIDGKELTDFNRIFVETDNTSAAESWNGEIDLMAWTVSDLNIVSPAIITNEAAPSEIILNDGGGVLRLNDHIFDIRSADTLDVEKILPGSYLFIVNDKIIKFVGISNSVKLNNKDIIMSDFNYWLKFKPEIISGFGVLIAALLALLSYYFLFRQETMKNKDEKQRILNVLLAEFKTNKKFIEELKNSIDDVIKNLGEIQVKFANFLFLGFRDDGFNIFRNLGGFQYIDTKLYDKVASYYVNQYKIHMKFNKIISDKQIYKLMGQDIKDLKQEIESIESLNEKLRNELESEIQKT